jgi:uncharacterized membrane protein
MSAGYGPKTGREEMDFVLKYIESVPTYFRDLISFISAPRAFLVRQSELPPDEVWPRALSFFACSAIIAYVMHVIYRLLPLAQNPNFMGFFVFTLIVCVGVFCLAVAIKMSCRR